jgi:hypothetical protein
MSQSIHSSETNNGGFILVHTKAGELSQSFHPPIPRETKLEERRKGISRRTGEGGRIRLFNSQRSGESADLVVPPGQHARRVHLVGINRAVDGAIAAGHCPHDG